MPKYSYVNTTTTRFRKWFWAYWREHDRQPSLDKMLHWLRNEEDYASPLSTLHELCDGLAREPNDANVLKTITNQLIDELEEERKFAATVKDFFNAMVSRCGIDGYDVKLIDEATGERTGSLHDLQLRKEVSNEAT